MGCETKTWIKCRGARSRSRNDISITPDAMTEARVCYRARGIKAVRDKGRKKKRESKSEYIYICKVIYTRMCVRALRGRRESVRGEHTAAAYGQASSGRAAITTPR